MAILSRFVVLSVSLTLESITIAAVRRIRELVRRGELGRVAHCHWHVGTLRTLINSKSNWQAAADCARGRARLDAAATLADLVEQLVPGNGDSHDALARPEAA